MTVQGKDKNKEKSPVPKYSTVILLIFLIIMAIIYCSLDTMPTKNEITTAILISLGSIIMSLAYYKSKKDELKKIHLSLGATFLVSGLFEMLTFPVLNEGYFIFARMVLLLITTFISLFVIDAIKKS